MAALTFTIDGRELKVIDAAGRDAVGEHFRVKVRALGEDDKPKDLVGKPFELKMTSRAGDELTMTGIVASVSSTYARGVQNLDIELGPEAELLAHGQGSHVYLAKSSVDIGKAVLSRAGVTAATWTISGSPKARPYTVQSRESDWDFLDRITREDGMYAFYEHGASGTKLAFADDSTKAEKVSGTFLHRTHHGTTPTEAWVSSLSSRAALTTDAFATRDRDPLKPKVAVGATEKDGEGKREIYAWPARLDASGDAKARAKTALESLRARRVVVTGASDSVTIRCGKVFEIKDGPTPDALRKLFCVAVAWTMDDRRSFSLSFTAVPADVPFRLPLREAARAPLGPETAFVRGASGQEIDADEHARVITQPPWDREGKKDDSCSTRARPGQPALARSMVIPRVGWSMLVDHLDGDVDRPWVMARLIDGTHPPPYKMPGNMTRTSWQTLTSASDGTLSEIVFEDKEGQEQLLVNAARDMKVDVGDNEARTVGNRHVVEVTKDMTVTIDADDKLTVTKDQTVTVKGAESTTIEGSRSVTVKGKEDATVDGDRAEAIKAARTIDVGKKRKLSVSGKMSATTKKGLTREVLKKLTAKSGGAWSIKADGGIVTTTKGDSAETVSGARTQNGKKGVQTLVKGDLKDTIAAAHTVTAKGSVGESAKGKMALTVGAAMTATAPQIEIVADKEITIVCGGSTITIKSSEVSIKSPAVAVAGPLVTSNGAQVKHNP